MFKNSLSTTSLTKTNNDNLPSGALTSSDQNARFFDSSTLYKKELKQKQREIIAPTTSSLSFANAISTTITNNDKSSKNNGTEHGGMDFNSCAHFSSHKNQQALKEEHEDIDDRILNKETPPQPVSTSNKMLNLFSSFLNRNHSKTLLNQNFSYPNSSNPATNNGNSNHLNIKNLKRATSSNNFGVGSKIKVNSNSSTNEAPKSFNKVLSNPVALLSNSNNIYKNRASEIPQSKPHNTVNLESNFSFMKTNNKQRRSYDDVSKLSIQVTDSSTHEQSQLSSHQNNFFSPDTSKLIKSENMPKNKASSSFETNLIKDLNSPETENIFIDLSNNSKFENTAFSTKNNGLIFLPSPTKIQSSLEDIEKQNKLHNDIYEPVTLDNLKKNYDSLSLIDLQLKGMQHSLIFS
jgi:hypothetical protein